MSGTHARPALASYRDKVTELVNEGAPFGDVEDAIHRHPGLTEDQKAALWLFAFSLRDRSEQQRDAQAHLTAVQAAAGEVQADAAEAVLRERADGARPQEFDGSGFPVPQPNRSFLGRVARLLNPQ